MMEDALLYLRVSSKGQEDGYSLDAQEKLGFEYAKKHNLNIIKVWRGAESAWGKIERRKFGQMIDYAKKHNNVRHIIFDILDRMTRNDSDKIKIVDLVRSYNKTIHFSRSNKIYSRESSPDDEFMLDIEVAVAKKMSNDISRKTTMGMKEKAEQGIYPSNCPLGYVNNHKTGGIDVDPQAAPLVKELFERIASGSYSLAMMEEEMFAKGLRHKTRHTKIPKTTLYRMVYNPFYYGEFMWGHKMYKGTHTPLVSKELWDKATAMLGNTHRPMSCKKKYAFRGLLRCKVCDCTVLGETQKGHIYYRCSFSKGQHAHKGYIREEELTHTFGNVVKTISISKDFGGWLLDGISQISTQQGQLTENRRKVLQDDYNKTKGKLSKLYDFALEGQLNHDMFAQKERELNNTLQTLQNSLDAMGKDKTEIFGKAHQTIELLSNLSNLYEKADNFEKANILKLVGNYYILDGREIQADFRLPFNHLARFAQEEHQPLEKAIKNLPSIGKVLTEPKGSSFAKWGG
ncbi:MAG: recombinase family protein [Spirochaetes bacterium]|nr:recombinase family protein [Spirochaetota bacterium]MCI7535554.1 recombinase family protein [Spirochaetota bacterium]MDY6129384.1 recombinase family protein [Elusimicrobiaceae bacterium]